MQAVPSAVSTRTFIEPSGWAPAPAQPTPGAISSGPGRSRASSRGAVGPGADEDGVAPAEDQVPPRGRPRRDAHVAAEDEKARFELDVDQVEDFDLERHVLLLPLELDSKGDYPFDAVRCPH